MMISRIKIKGQCHFRSASESQIKKSIFCLSLRLEAPYVQESRNRVPKSQFRPQPKHLVKKARRDNVVN